MKLSAVLCTLIIPIAAQFPPIPEGVKVVKSTVINGAQISYKNPKICETTPGVDSFSGYVKIPRGTPSLTGVADGYDINLFFWYFKARRNADKAPTTLWLTGGPGASSTKGIFQEIGPCEISSDSKKTKLREYSWSNEANMLFIDQPVQSGLSYDRLVNGSVHILQDRLSRLTIPNFKRGSVKQTTLLSPGTFPSNSYGATTNTSANAAMALWHVLQVFLNDFPEHKTTDRRFSIWGESYGGRFVPRTAGYIQRANDNMAKQGKSNFKKIQLHSIGIIAGCIDKLVEGVTEAQFAYNNTYGKQLASPNAYQQAKSAWPVCASSINRCRQLAKQLDPSNRGGNAQVNNACQAPFQACGKTSVGLGGRSSYDIANPQADPEPHPHMAGYLAQREIQKALGIQINYTEVIQSVNQVFVQTGDMNRGGPIDDMALLLDNDVKIALVFGDRDAACNWFGGEAVSLAIPHKNQAKFRSAGYVKLETPKHTGMTRQVGGLSFTNVFQAGHAVPFSQPEASYEIFKRVTNDLDVATGKVNIGKSNHATTGPPNILSFRQTLGPTPQSQCYLLALQQTCPKQTEAKLRSGTARIQDYIVT